MVRMNKLVDQARLAHSRFAHDRHDLTAAAARNVLRAAELLNLHVAADEARQATFGGDLKASSRVAGARQLIDLQWMGHSLHRQQAEWFHADVAFRQAERIACRER